MLILCHHCATFITALSITFIIGSATFRRNELQINHSNIPSHNLDALCSIAELNIGFSALILQMRHSDASLCSSDPVVHLYPCLQHYNSVWWFLQYVWFYSTCLNKTNNSRQVISAGNTKEKRGFLQNRLKGVEPGNILPALSNWESSLIVEDYAFMFGILWTDCIAL